VTRISQLAELVKEQVPGLFDEAHDEIERAITVAAEEAKADEKDPPKGIALTIKVRWDFGSNTVDVTLPVPSKITFRKTEQLEDDSQPKLPMGGQDE
jgi:hypothetical protein